MYCSVPCRFLFVLVLFTAVESARGADNPPGSTTLTIAEIRGRVRTHENRLKSLRAEFRSWHRPNAGTPRHERYVVAAKAGRRFNHLWHGEYPIAAEDPRAYIQLLTGDHWAVMNTYFRRYDVTERFSGRPYIDKILFHPLFESLGWWPPGEAIAPPRRDGRRIFHGDLLDDERCRVAGSELIDGKLCQIVEIPGLERFWVDHSRGVVLRRTFLDGPDSPELAQYESSDFREVAPEIFLPFRLRRIPKSLEMDIETIIDKYDVNDVGDDQFHVALDPGTLVYDRDTDTFRQEPGGLALMERLVDWVRASCPPPQRSGLPVSVGLAFCCMAGIAIGVTAAHFRSLQNLHTVLVRAESIS